LEKHPHLAWPGFWLSGPYCWCLSWPSVAAAMRSPSSSSSSLTSSIGTSSGIQSGPPSSAFTSVFFTFLLPLLLLAAYTNERLTDRQLNIVVKIMEARKKGGKIGGKRGGTTQGKAVKEAYRAYSCNENLTDQQQKIVNESNDHRHACYQRLKTYDGRDEERNTFVVGKEDLNFCIWWRGQVGLKEGQSAAVGRRREMLEEIGVDFDLVRLRRALRHLGCLFL